MLVCSEAARCCLQRAACQIREPARSSAGDQRLWLMSVKLVVGATWRDRVTTGEYTIDSQSWFIFLAVEKKKGGRRGREDFKARKRELGDRQRRDLKWFWSIKLGAMPTKYLVPQMVKDNTLTKGCHATKSQPQQVLSLRHETLTASRLSRCHLMNFSTSKCERHALFSGNKALGSCSCSRGFQGHVLWINMRQILWPSTRVFDSQAVTGRMHIKAGVWFISLPWLLRPFKWETLAGIMFTDILLKTARVQRADTGSLYQLHRQRRTTTATVQTKDVCQINACSFTPRKKKSTRRGCTSALFVLQWQILMGRHRSHHS